MNPVFVAIDTPDLNRAKTLAEALGSEVGGLKLGLEFFSANGPDGVRTIGEVGLPIFLDLKLHDIPNTVTKAVEALAPLRPAILTVHAAGGRAMMESAKTAAPPATKVVGVTVLTSLDGSDLDSIGCRSGADEQVLRLAALARESGLDGIVCSGAEISKVRNLWPEGFFVVPGIRPTPFVPSEVEGRGRQRVSTSLETSGDDQKRTVTPNQAFSDGASVLVIGRPITGADDPAAAARTICDSLKGSVE